MAKQNTYELKISPEQVRRNVEAILYARTGIGALEETKSEHLSPAALEEIKNVYVKAGLMGENRRLGEDFYKGELADYLEAENGMPLARFVELGRYAGTQYGENPFEGYDSNLTIGEIGKRARNIKREIEDLEGKEPSEELKKRVEEITRLTQFLQSLRAPFFARRRASLELILAEKSEKGFARKQA